MERSGRAADAVPRMCRPGKSRHVAAITPGESKRLVRYAAREAAARLGQGPEDPAPPTAILSTRHLPRHLNAIPTWNLSTK